VDGIGLPRNASIVNWLLRSLLLLSASRLKLGQRSWSPQRDDGPLNIAFNGDPKLAVQNEIDSIRGQLQSGCKHVQRLALAVIITFWHLK
jgi:hypothetical protein